jgi:hypothetical protein
MIFPKLPDDLLRHVPWKETIPSWPINEHYLASLADLEAELDQLGYYLRYGIEANIRLFNKKDAKKFLRGPFAWVYEWRQSCREVFETAYHAQPLQPNFDVYEEIYQVLHNIAVEKSQSPDPSDEDTEWLRDWATTQTFYRAASRYARDNDKRDLARKDFFLAVLHLLPQSLGGLRGLVENRFASAHYGYGWWDGKDIPELRTRHAKGFKSAITSYHEILWRVAQATEKFGFVTSPTTAFGQAHFSIWRKADDTNLFATKDATALQFQLSIATALHNCLLLTPLRDDLATSDDKIIYADTPIVGSSRVSAVRLCEGGHWELRLPRSRGSTHLPRDLYLILTATLAALRPEPNTLTIEELGTKQPETPHDAQPAASIIGADYPMQRAIEEAFSKGASIGIARKIKVGSDTIRVACPFISSLQAAIVQDDGYLDLPIGAAAINTLMMLNRIGRACVDLYSVMHDGKPRNLGTAYGWKKLFDKIRINEDGTLDTSALPPEIAEHFSGLRITETYHDLHGGKVDAVYLTLSHPIAYTMAAMLATGHRSTLLPNNQTAHQRAIYEFYRARDTGFDPEDGLTLFSNQLQSYKGKKDALYVLTMLKDEIYKKLITRHTGPLLNYNKRIAANAYRHGEAIILDSIITGIAALRPAAAQLHRIDPKVDKFLAREIVKFLSCERIFLSPENIGELQYLDLGVLAQQYKTTLDNLIQSGRYDTISEDSIENAKLIIAASMKEYVEEPASSFVRLAAAAQTSVSESINVLHDFCANAATMFSTELTIRFDPRESEFLDGLIASAARATRNTAEALLNDPTPVLNLRAQHLKRAGLKIT